MWNINSNIKEKYLAICKKATEDDAVFSTFRRNPDYRQILEHVSEEQGWLYLNDIKENRGGFSDEYLELLQNNEIVGQPYTYNYNGLQLSPTTIRYLKVLSDLINWFGSLDNLNIIEVGGGYGGLCKIICDFFKPAKYVIMDDPSVVPLQKKFLNLFGYNNDKKRWLMFNEYEKVQYDLFISNYAFDELSDELRLSYKPLLDASKGFYITSINDISEYTKPYSPDYIDQSKYFKSSHHKINIKLFQ